MRRFAAVLLCITFFLVACSGQKDSYGQGMALRQKILEAKSCAFQSEITIDFGENQYTFSLDCSADTQNGFSFSVVAPKSISGITGSVDDSNGKITFDETLLAFPTLADGEIAPVAAPWLFWKALSGGYLRACGTDTEGLRLTIDDSYRGENLQVDVWLDEYDMPFRAEILWQGTKFITIAISQFQIL